VCSGLSWLGFEAPSSIPDSNGRVSASASGPAIYVIPADEERTIAAQVRTLI